MAARVSYHAPVVVCGCGLSLSSGAPLSGGVGLGLIGRRLTKNLLAKEVVCKKFRRNYFFSKLYAIMPPARHFGDKKMNLLGVKLGMRGSQNHFSTAVAKVVAQSRFIQTV
jgi:hypothetical protein